MISHFAALRDTLRKVNYWRTVEVLCVIAASIAAVVSCRISKTLAEKNNELTERNLSLVQQQLELEMAQESPIFTFSHRDDGTLFGGKLIITTSDPTVYALQATATAYLEEVGPSGLVERTRIDDFFFREEIEEMSADPTNKVALPYREQQFLNEFFGSPWSRELEELQYVDRVAHFREVCHRCPVFVHVSISYASHSHSGTRHYKLRFPDSILQPLREPPIFNSVVRFTDLWTPQARQRAYDRVDQHLDYGWAYSMGLVDGMSQPITYCDLLSHYFGDGHSSFNTFPKQPDTVDRDYVEKKNRLRGTVEGLFMP